MITDVSFYGPERHWYGWQTLIPFSTGGDEYGRKTLLIGWTITGRIVFAFGSKGWVNAIAKPLPLMQSVVGYSRGNTKNPHPHVRICCDAVENCHDIAYWMPLPPDEV